MADLVFKYGTMGSGKTIAALMLRFSYLENGKKVLLLKPSVDNRDGIASIKSRIGISADALTYDKEESILHKFMDEIMSCDCIILDEVQFSNKDQIEELKVIAEELNKPVFAFGLRTDFQTNLWEGSKRLFELATKIEELPINCACGNSAIVNARIDESGNIVYKGRQVKIGGSESYKALCYKCYRKGHSPAEIKKSLKEEQEKTNDKK